MTAQGFHEHPLPLFPRKGAEDEAFTTILPAKLSQFFEIVNEHCLPRRIVCLGLADSASGAPRVMFDLA